VMEWLNLVPRICVVKKTTNEPKNTEACEFIPGYVLL